MNRALLPDMLHSMAAPDITVLERQRARLKWEHEPKQQHENYNHGVFQSQQRQNFQGDLADVVISSSDLIGSGFDFNFAVSRTFSCPPSVAAEAAAAAAVLAKGRESVASEKLISVIGSSDSFKKRKAVVADDKFEREKMIKTCKQGEADSISKIADKNGKNNNKETCTDNSRDSSMLTEIQKPDYIHVRARRGQATDNHSLAERVRREKISERMKYLQDLVPGCNKITGKAGMLDEIINYVQSLQRQVEFLSMKLAAVNPTRLDFNNDNVFAKEMFPSCQITNFRGIGMSSDMSNPVNYLQVSPAEQQEQEQLVAGCELELEMEINFPDTRLRRTISAPVSIPQSFMPSSCFNESSTWDADLQNLCNVSFDHGRSTYLTPQPFTGTIHHSNLMEM